MPQENENLENSAPVQDTPAPAEQSEAPAAPETPAPDAPKEEPAKKPAPEAPLAEKLANLAAKKDAKESKEGEAPAAPAGETPSPGFKPNVTFKAGVYNKETKQLEQKEFTIDPAFASLMKDPESEKKVRELHEKAYGLDSIKERFTEAKQTVTELQTENQAIKGSIDGLRKIYSNAVKSGNPHKLDKFFETLRIPQNVVLQYALAKVQLSEMPEEQRNAILGQLSAEDRAEQQAQQLEATTQETMSSAQQLKLLQLESALVRPEISALATEFDARVGKPGAFRAQIEREGQLAWLRDQVDLTPEQAIQKVIENYALTTKPLVPPAQQPAATPAPAQQPTPGANNAPTGQGTKPIVQKTTKTLPNIHGSSASPLKSKVKSIDDIKKHYNETYVSKN